MEESTRKRVEHEFNPSRICLAHQVRKEGIVPRVENMIPRKTKVVHKVLDLLITTNCCEYLLESTAAFSRVNEILPQRQSSYRSEWQRGQLHRQPSESKPSMISRPLENEVFDRSTRASLAPRKIYRDIICRQHSPAP